MKTVADLVAQLRLALPSLIGHVHTTDPVLVFDQADSAAQILRLHASLSQQHPEGGKAFWQCRTWNLLIWQPIYVSILTVYLSQQAVCLEGMGVVLVDDVPSGYCLPEHPLVDGVEALLIERAGLQVATVCEQVYQALVTHVPFNPKLAKKLQIDCMVSALLYCGRHLYDWDGATLTQQVRLWLTAAELPDVVGTLDLGGNRLALNRQACCQEFRLERGVLCPSCPRIPMDERLLLMAAS